MTRIAVPALVVLVAVAAMVGVAGWNRSGDPRLVLTLTERELPRQWANQTPDEDPSRLLQIEVQSRHDPLDSLNWLPEARLRAIGFPSSVAAGAPEAADTYAKTPSRLAWVVLELDGPAWRDIERRRALQPEPEPMQQRPSQSRLVPVDAGPELDPLLRRYPSGHLIVQAIIDVHFLPPDRGGPLVYGTMERMVPGRLTVPAHLRPVLDALPPDGDAGLTGPRYEAEVALGRLGMPYLRTLRAGRVQN